MSRALADQGMWSENSLTTKWLLSQCPIEDRPALLECGCKLSQLLVPVLGCQL